MDSRYYPQIQKQAEILGVEFEALLAVINVESNGAVFAKVDGKDMPLIRWEGHYFDRLIKPEKRQQARAQGLASPKAQAIPNPKSQQARYDLLTRAKRLDSAAAIMSCSWGFAQIMGSHWELLGYKNAQEFEQVVKSGFPGQLEIFIRFLKKSGIVPHLKRKDWSAVARMYNGPNYAKFSYDKKLQDEYKKLTGFKNSPKSAGMLRAGSKGAAVKEAQTLLNRAGYPLEIDSDFGPSTEAALTQFQKDHGLEADGVLGPLSKAQLYNYKNSPEEEVGITTVTENKTTVKSLLTGVGGAIGIETINNKIDTMVEKTSAYPILDYLSTGLTVLSVVLGFAGIAYGAYTFYKANKTELGTQ